MLHGRHIGANLEPYHGDTTYDCSEAWPRRLPSAASAGKGRISVTHILVVEDEEQLAGLIRDQLVSAGYSVAVAGDGMTALHLMETRPADLVILDWMLPGIDGLEVCRRLRARSITPILMLTARAEEIDRVLGLEVGADDYLTKPFSMRELLARARALLRRVDLMTHAQRGATRPRDGARGH